MQLFDVYPLNDIEITKAAGSNVWDANDQKYLDLYGGHAVISIGHTNPHYVNRLTDQLNKVGFYSNSVKIPLQVQLAQKLGEVSGKKDFQLFLVNSGAEANENALKLASFHTGRKKIVAFYRGFHGRTSLAVAATDNPKIIAPVNETDHIIFLPFNDENAVRECFKAQGEQIAAVIVEGIQGIGGIHVASDVFLQSIRAGCDAYGSVFVADSVQCGYGRSGRFFAHDWTGVSADIYTVAKGMGNGFPVAGVCIAPHILAVMGMLGTTFGGNPLACAAALAVLEVIEDQQLMANAATIGEYLIHALQNIPEVTAVRGRGLMIGFEMIPEHSNIRQRLLQEAGIFTGEAKNNVVRLLPSLALAQTEADYFLHHFKQLL